LNSKKRRKITLWNWRGSTWNKYATTFQCSELFSIIKNLDMTYWFLSEQSFETRLWEEFGRDTCATWEGDRGACWNQNHAHSPRCWSFQCKTLIGRCVVLLQSKNGQVFNFVLQMSPLSWTSSPWFENLDHRIAYDEALRFGVTLWPGVIIL
jgi:hypothetical protein